MDKKILMIIAVGTVVMIAVGFGVVNFVIKPKTDDALRAPLLDERMPDASADLFEEEDPIPFTEQFTVIPAPDGITANPLGSPENYLVVTIAIHVNEQDLFDQLDSETAKNMVKAILLRKLVSRSIEDVDTPEEKDELLKELDKDIRKMVTDSLGSDIWEKEGYRMTVEFVSFLIA